MRYRFVLFAILCVQALACSEEAPRRAIDGGHADAGDHDAAGPTLDSGSPRDASTADASTASLCDEEHANAIRIYGASLGDASSQLDMLAELTGPGVTAVSALKAAGLPVVSWVPNGLMLFGTTGFWDVPLNGPAVWHDLPGLATGALAADFDGDGDADPMVSFAALELVDEDGGTAAPMQLTHLIAWERTAAGLVERGPILQGHFFFGPPLSPADLDGDGKLDLLSYEHDTVVGYMNQGDFVFSRKELGEKSALNAEEGTGTVGLLAADRNGDDAPDLLVALGGTFGTAFTVRLNDGHGAFLPPESETREEPVQGGLAFGDVSGDGVSDAIDISVRTLPPKLRLSVSESASTLGTPVVAADDALGLQLADVDHDGVLDMLISRQNQLVGVSARGGEIEEHELGLALPDGTLGFAADPGLGSEPAHLYVASYVCEN